MRALTLALLLALAACRSQPVVNASQYICPGGQTVWAGLTADKRLMRLRLAGRTHTLLRQADGNSYGGGHYTARADDLFLHLNIPGTLLPQHCRLVIDAPSAGR